LSLGKTTQACRNGSSGLRQHQKTRLEEDLWSLGMMSLWGGLRRESYDSRSQELWGWKEEEGRRRREEEEEEEDGLGY
jgi:hypothetical protein